MTVSRSKCQSLRVRGGMESKRRLREVTFGVVFGLPSRRVSSVMSSRRGPPIAFSIFPYVNLDLLVYIYGPCQTVKVLLLPHGPSAHRNSSWYTSTSSSFDRRKVESKVIKLLKGVEIIKKRGNPLR